jgi:Fur family transcriptional regulator, ferric uptake regulator
MPAESLTTTPPTIIQPLCAVFRRKLKQEGLKYTHERARVLDVAIRFTEPFDAEHLLAQVRGSDVRVSKATIYRTLRLLVEAGIIQRVPLSEAGEEQAFYQVVDGSTPRPRDMIIRTDTKQLIPIELPQLEALRDQACAALGLVPQGHRLYIYAAAHSQGEQVDRQSIKASSHRADPSAAPSAPGSARRSR